MDKLERARAEINRIDAEITGLFSLRMEAVRSVAEHKAENGLPISNPEREGEVINQSSVLLENKDLKNYHAELMKSLIKISKDYQAALIPSESLKLANIVFGRGELENVSKHFNLSRKVLIVSDTGVPSEYASRVARECQSPHIYVIEQGEDSKSIQNYEKLLSHLADNNFTRTDCVVAVGGGVVGDLAGFVASSYMRGIDFYNIPTTLLSQVDSSIGGKVAVNLGGYKNIVGAFYAPKCVIVDPELLQTLDKRQFNCGLAEALKMATTSDKELFEIFEDGEELEKIDEVIFRSLLIKKGIVDRDFKESGERKILNFGHTIGHALESTTDLLHGECVALGMLSMCDAPVKKRLLKILQRIGLPTEAKIDADKLYSFILHDKKADGEKITITYSCEIGRAELRKIDIEDIKNYL